MKYYKIKNHNFHIYVQHGGGQGIFLYKYQCSKCNCKFTRITLNKEYSTFMIFNNNKLLYDWVDDDRFKEILLTCNEYMIKNIIE